MNVRVGSALRRYGSALLAWTVVAVLPHPCGAETTCEDICPGTGDCWIASLELVEPASVIDCSGRDIVLGNDGTLKVIDGGFTLLADDLTVYGPTAWIGAVEGTDELATRSIAIELTGQLSLSGKIRANGDHGGGRIEIVAAGNIDIAENGTDGIEAGGLAPGASGGSIELESGGDIFIRDPIHAEGSGAGDNGGGSISIVAAGNIECVLDGHVSAPGRSYGGGSVELIAGGDIVIDEHIDVTGHGDTAAGGSIRLEAAGSVSTYLPISAPGGIGASGGDAAGGTFHIEAGCGGVVIGADVDLTSGTAGAAEGDGGSFVVDSSGPVAIGDVTIDAHSRQAGGGGAIVVRSGRTLTVASGARLDTRGSNDSTEGTGADIELHGCNVAVQPSAVLDASGAAGGNVVIVADGVLPQGSAPVFVSAAASILASATNADAAGTVMLEAYSDHEGECSNDANLLCWVDTDCTVGCQTGTCLDSNPDTDGVTSQFSGAIVRAHVNGAGTLCTAACGE